MWFFFSGFFVSTRLKMETNEEFPNFSVDLDFEKLSENPQNVTDEINPEVTQKSSRFAELSDENLDAILDAGQAKTTKYATNFGIKVFKGKKTLLVTFTAVSNTFITHITVFA